MDPFRNDPFDPFGGGLPGDPMEEVLSLQSYSLGESGASGNCPSNTSVIIDCPSNVSSIQQQDRPVS